MLSISAYRNRLYDIEIKYLLEIAMKAETYENKAKEIKEQREKLKDCPRNAKRIEDAEKRGTGGKNLRKAAYAAGG